jgi:uncharacterized protein
MFRLRTLAIVGVVVSSCAFALQAQSNFDQAKWLQDLNTWRAKHAADVSAPEGWLSLVALDWLRPGENSVGSASTNRIRLPEGPAEVAILRAQYSPVRAISIGADGASAAPKKPDLGTLPPQLLQISVIAPTEQPGRRRGGFPPDFLIDGKPPDPDHEFTIDMDDDGLGQVALRKFPSPPNLTEEQKRAREWHATVLTVGRLSMSVIHRGDNAALRVKDADSPNRESFHGLHWYGPNQDYRVLAKWVPYNPVKVCSMSTVIGTTLQLPCPGAAEFQIRGNTYRLEPAVEDPDEERLFFVMRDLTSNASGKSYPAGRFLYTAYPDHGLDQPGHLWLDFNRLENPPCAYTAYATCPLPPRANRLNVELPVGEQRYHN